MVGMYNNSSKVEEDRDEDEYATFEKDVMEKVAIVIFSIKVIPFAHLRKVLRVLRLWLTFPDSPNPDNALTSGKTNFDMLEAAIGWVYLLMEVSMFKLEALSNHGNVGNLKELFSKLIWIEDKGIDAARMMNYFYLNCDDNMIEGDKLVNRQLQWLQASAKLPMILEFDDNRENSIDSAKKILREVIHSWTTSFQSDYDSSDFLTVSVHDWKSLFISI